MRKNIQWLVISGLIVLALLIGIIGCASPPPPSTAKPPSPTVSPSPSPAPKPAVIRWRGQSAYAAGTPPVPSRFPWPYYAGGQMGQFFADWIKEATGGRLVIDMASPGGVVPVADMFTATSKGTLDFAGLYYGGNHTGLMPETDIEIGLPFAWENAAEEWDALYNFGLQKEFEKLYAESNIWPQLFGMDSIYGIAMKGQATSPDFIKGKKIRATGIYGRLVQVLGGSPVNIPQADMYMALKLGTIDGAIGGGSFLTEIKLNEVVDSYVQYPSLNNVGGSFLFNLNSLKALPEDIRNIIYRDASKAAAFYAQGFHTQVAWSILSSQREGRTKAINWSAEDAAKVRAMAVALWDEIAAKSPRTAKLVDVVKAQARDMGKIK